MDGSCRAFLIDPAIKAVLEIEWVNKDFKTIAPILGCALFTTIVIDSEDNVVFVDDEGQNTYPNKFGYFQVDGYPGILAGRGLILGTDETGASVAPRKLTLNQLRQKVTFVSDPDPVELDPIKESRGFTSFDDMIKHFFRPN